MSKLFLVFASLSGFTAVMLGAFGAHALKQKLDATMLNAYQTGVEYQFYHSIALLVLGLLMVQLPSNRWLEASGLFFIAGIILFSGSLYGLALTEIRTLGPVNIGLLTPLGGTAFMLGWLALAAGVLAQNQLPG